MGDYRVVSSGTSYLGPEKSDFFRLGGTPGTLSVRAVSILHYRFSIVLCSCDGASIFMGFAADSNPSDFVPGLLGRFVKVTFSVIPSLFN